MKKDKRRLHLLLLFFLGGALILLFLSKATILGPLEYNLNTASTKTEEPPQAIQHIKTPEIVRGIYMTSWVAGTPKWRTELIDFVKSTELNSVIVDVKDYTGRISFEVENPVLKKIGAAEKRIPDIKELIEKLHGENIYAIARISVFQDPYLASQRPDLAVKKKDGGVWKDHKGIKWVDPANKEVWQYAVQVAREAEKVGFDELNFDYVRFPSDGNMKDIDFDHWDDKTPMAEIIRQFFAYLSKNLKDSGVPLSVDLFGMTTVNTDDLNIGQILENAIPYFDYISPMVYPSHYPSGFLGYKNPAAHPYEIIKDGMSKASERLIVASSTPLKLRPWLQDFDLGANYDKAMILKEKQAVYDAGLNSWLMWDPANKYTKAAFLPREASAEAESANIVSP